MSKNVVSIILAAGEGTRMKSSLPKVLHRICGKPMISYVLSAVFKAGIKRNYIVVGHKREKVIEEIDNLLSARNAVYVRQSPLLGSGHAVMQVKRFLKSYTGSVLVTCADLPLLSGNTISSLVSLHMREKNRATLLGALVADPFGYGRIIQDARGEVVRIVEEKDATEEERKVRKINSGVYCFERKDLFEALDKVRPDNAKREYYLTDVIRIMKEERKKIGIKTLRNGQEITGVNTAGQLAGVEKYMKKRSDVEKGR